MYWIDINLLNDREEFSDDSLPSAIQVQDDKTPMFLGLGVGVAAIAIAFAAYGVTGFINQNLTAQEEEVTAKISQLSSKLKEVEQLQQEKAQIEAETQALAKIFSKIKPWSAMLADLRARIPSTLQINSIAQTATTPQGGSNLVLSGKALNFGDVNDFVLTLRQSNYLQEAATQTKLNNAKLNEGKGGDLVEYKIATQVNSAPAESLLSALRQNGASGLVSRIETLKRQGVMKP